MADPTEQDVLKMLSKIPADGFAMIDGHELRSPWIRKSTQLAVDKGWLDLGELIEGDQWSWYEAKVTPQGREAIKELDHD